MVLATAFVLHCGNPDPPAESIWGACPDASEFAGSGAECTTVDVPLREGSTETIPIFVARVRGKAAESTKRGQLWFVSGGPGQSVTGFVPQSKLLAELHPEWDYYSFEQRGTGYSDAFICPGTEGDAVVPVAEVPGCLAELAKTHPEGIADYTVTNTARDLATAIDRLRTPGKKVAVYGVSYGTYLLQRFMALFPNQADELIIDSIAAAGFADYDTFDRNMNDAVHMIMDRCGQDPECTRRLTPVAADPWTALTVTRRRLEQGRLCEALQQRLGADPLDVEDLRNLFGRMAERTGLRGLMPATVLRLNRCSPDDVDALENLVNNFLRPAPGASRTLDPGPGSYGADFIKFSVPLYTHLVLSELWSGTPRAQLEAEEKTYNASLSATVPIAESFDAHVWPVYHDPLAGLHARTSRPVLMLNSDLDPQTPLALAQHVREDLHGPNQWFVAVPDAGHVVIFNSLMKGATGDQPTFHCGTHILFSFLERPESPPDTSCFADLQRLTFDAADPRNRENSLENFGTDDMWGDVPSAALASH